MYWSNSSGYPAIFSKLKPAYHQSPLIHAVGLAQVSYYETCTKLTSSTKLAKLKGHKIAQSSLRMQDTIPQSSQSSTTFTKSQKQDSSQSHQNKKIPQSASKVQIAQSWQSIKMRKFRKVHQKFTTLQSSSTFTNIHKVHNFTKFIIRHTCSSRKVDRLSVS